MLLHVLGVMLGLRGTEAWADAHGEAAQIFIDVDGRQHLFLSDTLAGRAEAPLIPWNETAWAALDAALAPDHAWMPPAVGVDHWLIRRRKLGAAACGRYPAPAIDNSS